jgi:hypothetical protein
MKVGNWLLIVIKRWLNGNVDRLVLAQPQQLGSEWLQLTL